MQENNYSSEENVSNNRGIIEQKMIKKTSKKVNYSVLKDLEIETELLNKLLSIQAKSNKKNILSGGKELTIKELLNSYIRKGMEVK